VEEVSSNGTLKSPIIYGQISKFSRLPKYRMLDADEIVTQ